MNKNDIKKWIDSLWRDFVQCLWRKFLGYSKKRLGLYPSLCIIQAKRSYSSSFMITIHCAICNAQFAIKMIIWIKSRWNRNKCFIVKAITQKRSIIQNNVELNNTLYNTKLQALNKNFRRLNSNITYDESLSSQYDIAIWIIYRIHK